MTTKEKAREFAFEELREYMQEWNYTNRRDALYDYLVEYYACAGFDEDWVVEIFSNVSEEELLRNFLSIFND